MNANIGKLSSGKCYVYLNGYKAEPFWGTEVECEAAILAHGVAEPIPVFVDGVDMTTSTKPAVAVKAANAVIKKPRRLREYVLTFTVKEKTYAGSQCFNGGTEKVHAFDRNDAMRQAREIWRHAEGPWGMKATINARLAP